MRRTSEYLIYLNSALAIVAYGSLNIYLVYAILSSKSCVLPLDVIC